MKKEELKRLLKPMVKECIKECLYEEGTLSTVVSEVVKGMSGGVIRENIESVPTAQPVTPMFPPQRERKSEALADQRKKLMDAIGADSYGGVNIFEGVTPGSAPRSPEAAASSPLGDMDPSDPGIDISSIVALGGKKWKAFTQQGLFKGQRLKMTTPHGYGRTRRPKELWNDDTVGTKQAGTSVTIVGAGDLNADINDGTAGHNGYSTENQRFLHLQIAQLLPLLVRQSPHTLLLVVRNYSLFRLLELIELLL